LLNTCKLCHSKGSKSFEALTVRAHQPNSHSGKGWEIFTDSIIKKISHEKKGVVFILWGKNAQAKASLIDKRRHHILTAAHPR
jgi:uracil-DNA glycosylase